MRPRRARAGHTLALVVLAVLALVAASAALTSRWTVDLLARERGAERVQALVLARSALAVELGGAREVATPQGPARVQVAREGGRRVARVTVGDTVATVWTAPWEERVQRRAAP